MSRTRSQERSPQAPVSAFLGLTDEEAAAIRAVEGPNSIPERPAPGLPARVAAQLRDPMIVLLMAAAVLTVLLHDVTDLAVISAVIVLNSGVGIVQEYRAEQALRALQAAAAPRARVWRAGALVERPAAQLVPGDRIVLEAGDVVPADAVLDAASGLEVDESALTGESVPVTKAAGGASTDGGSDAVHEVYAGTVVTRGRATARVTRIGARSAIGRIALLLGGEQARATPLQRRLNRLGRVLASAAVLAGAAVVVSGWLQGRPLGEVVLSAISLAVAAVPESLPAVVTLALALGAARMARSSAIARNLPAVETLGSVTVLLTDKTGTLTEGAMAVERLWDDEGDHDVAGVTGPAASARSELLRALVLCNDAALPSTAGGQERRGSDPTETALLDYAVRVGVPVDAVRRTHPRLGEVPFDSVTKQMTTVHATPDGSVLTVCKGAPEALIEIVGADAAVEAARAAADRLAAAGYRVLAVAAGTAAEPDEAASRLRLLGLVGMRDPVRADAPGVVERLQGAGISVLMVTGDHPATARSIAHRLRLRVGAVVTGRELDDTATWAQAADRTLFARTRPEQKLDIVAALQDQGHVVAMVGDGVNDAPALRRADVGVAMGGEGTEVAKQAADLILTDDNLRTIVAAVAEGRRIYDNIRTFLRYALAGGLAEIAVMLLGPAVGVPLALLPGQILWINLLTHGLPGVAFGAEPGDPERMSRPPLSPQQSVLGGGLARQVLVSGALLTIVSLIAARGASAQTAIFWTLGVAQLGTALALRRSRGGLRPGFLDLAVAGALLLQCAALGWRPLADVLGNEPLSWRHVAGLTLLACVPGVLVVLTRVLGRRRARFPGTQGPPALAARSQTRCAEREESPAPATVTEQGRREQR